jgi:hypothetical protein
MTEHDSLAQLIEVAIRDLEIARRQFDADEGASGRLGVLTALHVLASLSTVLLGNRAAELLAPIKSLQHALHDAERGTKHPLLKPRKHVGRPPNHTEYLGLAGTAAVLMQMQMDAGKSKSDAARQVARRLNVIGYRTPQGVTISSDLVDERRIRAMTERPVEDVVADRFARMLPIIKSQFPSDPNSAFERILENLPLMLPVRPVRPEKSD